MYSIKKYLTNRGLHASTNIFIKIYLRRSAFPRARLQLRRASGNFYFKNARFLLEFVDFWSRFSRKMFPKKTSKILKFITFSKILHFGGTHFHFRPSLAWCRLGWNSSIWKLKVCFQLLSEDILIYCVYLIQNWIQSDQKMHQRGKAESQPKAGLGPRVKESASHHLIFILKMLVFCLNL